jgi:pSer/pThr/pTyr-binding forkhead associated (FHA) protein
VSDPLLTLLTWCLLALLYLFFFRVLQATWAEVRAPRSADRPAVRGREGRGGSRPRLRGGGVRRLRVVEPADVAGRTYELGQEITVGRAAGCHITLDDTYVSQLHARVSARDGVVYVEDLGSTNGTYLNRQKVTGAVAASAGDRLQVGGTVLEFQ